MTEFIFFVWFSEFFVVQQTQNLRLKPDLFKEKKKEFLI